MRYESQTEALDAPAERGPGGVDWRSVGISLVMLLLIVLIYAASIWFRLPYITNPMGLHHDEGTARTLLHMAAWWEDGPSDGGYIMRKTLMSPGDKFLSETDAEDGNRYYYSFPPGHPLISFVAHKAVAVEPSVMSVRWFNLILGFISASMIYLLVRELLRGSRGAYSRIAGVISFTLYVFTPVGLWYHSNAYMSSSALQPFFIAALLFVAYSYRRRSPGPWFWPVLTGIAVALMCYTEWLGVAFVAITVVLWLLRRDDAVLRRIAIASTVAMVATMAVVVVQYTLSLGGVAAVIAVFADRYAIRSGLDAEGGGGWTLWRAASWGHIFRAYIKALGPLILGVGLLWAWERVLRRREPARPRSEREPTSTVLMLSIIPVLLHHAVLFDHTVIHDFNMLKTSVFFSLVAGVVVSRLLGHYASRGRWAMRFAVLGVLVVMAFVGYRSVWIFDLVNRYENYQSSDLGEAIAAEAQPEEVVFIKVSEERSLYVPYNQISWYAGRNYVSFAEEAEEREALLEQGGERTGVLFELDKDLAVVDVDYLGTDGRTYDTRAEAHATLGIDADTD